MSRALLLAAALALAPLPALCENVQNVQGNQSQAGGQMNQGARASEPSQAGQEEMSTSRGNRAELEDLLDRLSQSELRDRLESAVERVRQACAEDIQDVCD